MTPGHQREVARQLCARRLRSRGRSARLGSRRLPWARGRLEAVTCAFLSSFSPE